MNDLYSPRGFWQIFAGGVLALMSLVSCAPNPAPMVLLAPAKLPLNWTNVAIGGGGYVTGIQVHPRVSDVVYIQTDNGGFYRWDQAQQQWHPITDHFSRENSNFYGGEALALDPHNPDVVLIAVGQYVSEGMGTIFRSEDRGQNWKPSNLKVPMGADQDKRWAGNRLVVNPFDPQVVLWGSRQDGLWRSQDGGLTWKAVTQLRATPQSDIGIISIAFDPRTTGRVFLGAYGDGIYESRDAGQTWQRLSEGPAFPMKMAIAQDGALYVTSDRTPGMSRYHQGLWKDITPPGYRDQVFNGLSVHPTESKELIVMIGEAGSAEIFHSRNAGESWQQPGHQVTNTVPWWSEQFFRDHPSAIQFSPSTPKEVWLTDWFGIWKTEDFYANPVRWQNYQKGHEQVVVFSLISPPKGAPLLSGVADVNGFLHSRLDQFPSARLNTTGWSPLGQTIDQDTYSLAYSAHQPEQMVRMGGKRWNHTFGGYRSQDGGSSWTPLSAFPAKTLPLRVALSATNPQNFVVIVSAGDSLYTTDGGNSWQRVQGLPLGPKGPWIWSQPLAADGGQGDRFYYYAANTLYRSDNGGRSFVPIQSVPQAHSSTHSSADQSAVQTMPGLPNWLWLSLESQGLYLSKDGGVTLTRISSVSEAFLFSVGIGDQGAQQPVWYLYGTLATGQKGIFMSADQGQSWKTISETQVPIGARPRIMEASKQQIGLVFIGTNGRGIYYKQARPKGSAS